MDKPATQTQSLKRLDFKGERVGEEIDSYDRSGTDEL